MPQISLCKDGNVPFFLFFVFCAAVDDIVSLLLQLFPQPKHLSAAQQQPLRAGPIGVDASGRVTGVGSRLGLAGYDASVDDVIRWLCHLCRKFRADKSPHDWKADLQLLRLVGAPGVGKSTLLQQVWDRIKARLDHVRSDEQLHNQEKWQRWQQLGVQHLEQRLESWGSTPWVFSLDMSRKCRGQGRSQVCLPIVVAYCPCSTWCS